DADAAGGHERPGRPGDGAAHDAAPDPAGVRVAAAWGRPGSKGAGSRNGIFERSSAPTCSIWWSRSCWRSRLNCSPPESYSLIQRSAKEPDWMSERTSFIAAFAPSVTRGPET